MFTAALWSYFALYVYSASQEPRWRKIRCVIEMTAKVQFIRVAPWSWFVTVLLYTCLLYTKSICAADIVRLQISKQSTRVFFCFMHCCLSSLLWSICIIDGRFASACLAVHFYNPFNIKQILNWLRIYPPPTPLPADISSVMVIIKIKLKNIIYLPSKQHASLTIS